MFDTRVGGLLEVINPALEQVWVDHQHQPAAFIRHALDAHPVLRTLAPQFLDLIADAVSTGAVVVIVPD